MYISLSLSLYIYIYIYIYIYTRVCVCVCVYVCVCVCLCLCVYTVYILYIYCYRSNRGSVRIHVQSFIQSRGHRQAWFSKQQTDMNEARQRVVLGQPWVFDRRTVSNRAGQREISGYTAIIQAGWKHNLKQARYDYENYDRLRKVTIS